VKRLSASSAVKSAKYAGTELLSGEWGMESGEWGMGSGEWYFQISSFSSIFSNKSLPLPTQI
jgi:hypothetical protein